jgi:cytochrome c oxidase subunit 2
MHMNSRSFAIVGYVTAVFAVLAGNPAGMAPAQAPEPRVIDVVAKRYEFVPASIEATQGERLRIIVTSGDGLHGFGIKRFDVSKEIPRGGKVTIDFTADAVGEFPILCTEFCGDGHEQMKGVLVVKAAAGPPQ